MAVVKTQFTLRLDVETHAKIQKIAVKNNRSLTNMIDYLIKKEIANYESKNGEIALCEEDISLK